MKENCPHCVDGVTTDLGHIFQVKTTTFLDVRMYCKYINEVFICQQYKIAAVRNRVVLRNTQCAYISV